MKRISKLLVVLAAVVVLGPIGPLSSGWVEPASASGISGMEIITTVAGSGPAEQFAGGFGGDGGPATSALLWHPVGVAIDGSGNLFIADYSNRRIRKVAAGTGIITTVVGTDAGLVGPIGIAVDGTGNLFISDSSNGRIRKVDAGTGIITTVVGQLSDPGLITIDTSGNLFIPDMGNHRILKVDLATGIITTVAGTGTPGFNGDNQPATSAQLDNPFGVAVDGTGNLFISDSSNGRIRKVAAGTGIITTVAGTGTPGFAGDGGAATSAQLFYPSGLAVDPNGNLFLADKSNQRIRKVAAGTGIITTMAGTGTPGFSGDGGAAASAQLSNPVGIAFDSSGNLFVADQYNQRIRKVQAIIQVLIDIKPGSFPNSINLSSAGVVPVAILSSATFDATHVDPATVALAGATVKLIGKGDNFACSAQDVNEDGLLDLVCNVVTAQFMIEPGDSIAVLEAKTLSGEALRGEDSINIVP